MACVSTSLEKNRLSKEHLDLKAIAQNYCYTAQPDASQHYLWPQVGDIISLEVLKLKKGH